MHDSFPRPRLTPGVLLAGRLRESAYADPPWLVDRAGAGYVHVPELLYRVMERCDGQRTTADIADELAATTDRPLTEAHLRQLVEKKLEPSGLVCLNGAPQAVRPAPQRPGSPLRLGLRVRMIDPRRIECATRLLRVLYRPPLLALVLLVAGVCEGWLYLVHGVSGSLRQALYTPGLLIVIWSAVVLSAAFHELGHATALHYAGGVVRGMGFGFYLAFPAFYTDVSDNYRLSRWARVRTDLGGFYFNLIFIVGVVGLYLLTRYEWLLLIVVLINLDILHQLLPFVRLDGYWTLADLTGIPDFFSLMARRLRRQGRAPVLKPWARLVFGAYVVVTVPLLVVLLAVMIAGFPRVVATAWDALLQQLGGLEAAWAQADPLDVAAASLQTLVLALPVLGLASVLWSTARTGVGAVWAWGGASRLRRASSVVACAAGAALVGVAWLPQLAELAPRQPAALAQEPPSAPQPPIAPIGPGERGTLPDGLRELASAMRTRSAAAAVRATAEPTPRAVAQAPSSGAAARSPSDSNAPTGPQAAGRQTDRALARLTPARLATDAPVQADAPAAIHAPAGSAAVPTVATRPTATATANRAPTAVAPTARADIRNGTPAPRGSAQPAAQQTPSPQPSWTAQAAGQPTRPTPSPESATTAPPGGPSTSSSAKRTVGGTTPITESATQTANSRTPTTATPATGPHVNNTPVSTTPATAPARAPAPAPAVSPSTVSGG